MSDAQRGAPRFLVALGLLAGAACAADPPGGSLTAVSWGGSYARAINKAYYEPFEAATGVVIGRDDLVDGGLAPIRTQVDIGKVHWDVLSLESSQAIRACDEGLLEVIPRNILLPGADGSPASEDFRPGTLTECGVGHVVYSTIYAYHPDRFPDEKPGTIADFFDLERFPGRRGMRRSPIGNLEFALLADGVRPEEVYTLLDTAEGIRRVFRKLDTLRDHVVWWEAGAQPPQMLADAEVVMTTAYNGRIFNAQVLENQPFVIVWDGQLLDTSQIVVVAGAPNRANAFDYVRFATAAQSMARLTGHIAYAPARRSALPLVTTHVATGVPMASHLPTSPENLRRALQTDVTWWGEHLDEMNERFSAWLARS